MNNPRDFKYTTSHEWLKVGDDGLLWVGITDTAQTLLGDVVFVGDFELGAALEAGQGAGVVESVKAAVDVYAPVAGELVAFNGELDDAPELLNARPFDTWIFKLSAGAPLDGLLDADAYDALAAGAR
jgi:glycine cleavage system H protein